MEIKVKIWIEDNKQNLIFGSGKTEILKEIEKTGSISDASKNLNISRDSISKSIKNKCIVLKKYIARKITKTTVSTIACSR